MTRNQKILAGAGAVLAIIALIFIGMFIADELKPPSTDTAVFRSSQFSFSYPRTYVLKEYATGAVVVGTETENGFLPLTQAMRYKSDPDSPLPVSYDAYIRKQAEAVCGSDGNETVVCTSGAIEPYTSPTGLAGKTLTLAMTRTSLTDGSVTEATLGPVYVFDATPARMPDVPFRYQAIFVSPALAGVLAGTTTPSLLDEVMSTFVIGKATSTPEAL